MNYILVLHLIVFSECIYSNKKDFTNGTYKLVWVVCIDCVGKCGLLGHHKFFFIGCGSIFIESCKWPFSRWDHCVVQWSNAKPLIAFYWSDVRIIFLGNNGSELPNYLRGFPLLLGRRKQKLIRKWKAWQCTSRYSSWIQIRTKFTWIQLHIFLKHEREYEAETLTLSTSSHPQNPKGKTIRLLNN